MCLAPVRLLCRCASADLLLVPCGIPGSCYSSPNVFGKIGLLRACQEICDHLHLQDRMDRLNKEEERGHQLACPTCP